MLYLIDILYLLGFSPFLQRDNPASAPEITQQCKPGVDKAPENPCLKHLPEL
jgi:hypothetical protein